MVHDAVEIERYVLWVSEIEGHIMVTDICMI